jgi:EAL domain-containing protein (putative c-di-GMP-specific phosphodiesterase class I)
VTESIFQRDPDAAIATLERVLALGCTVSLDDFGTGHSSLDYLRKLQFASIKVDRGFVKGAGGQHREPGHHPRRGRHGTGAGNGHRGRGVETAEELAIMRDLGCTRVQGTISGGPWIPRPSPACSRGRSAGQGKR